MQPSKCPWTYYLCRYTLRVASLGSLGKPFAELESIERKTYDFFMETDKQKKVINANDHLRTSDNS